MVRGHGLDGQGTRCVVADPPDPHLIGGGTRLGSTFEHQGGQDFEIGVECLPMQGFCQGRRQARLGLFVSKARIGRTELQVCDQAIELKITTLDDDEGAFLDGERVHGQADPERFLNPPPTI